MNLTLDCRNLSCPEPVIRVKNQLKLHNSIIVTVDDGAPRENVARFARNRGYNVSESYENGYWVLRISPDGLIPADNPQTDLTENARVLLIGSDRLGNGPEELGKLLMRNFIHTLLETSTQPGRMLFLNTGVYLTCEGSEVLEALTKLQGMGVEIFSCGLCLDFFNKKESLKVGVVTNMLSTAENLLTAENVIQLP